jgi:hypothetical protein
MEKLLLLIYLSSFYAMASDRNSTDVDIPTSSLTFSYMKDNFRELNVQMTPFSDSRDDDAVEEERQGSGWRFATSNYRKHKNVIFYNHGHGGRKKEYYKFSNDHPWREDRPRRDLWSMSDWFDKYNVSFYAPLRKETEDLDGNYGRSIEPVEVFHHLTNTVKKLYENDVNICYVGHSEGGASTLFASMYFNGKHVAISPGYGRSPFHLTGNRYEKTPEFYNKSKNLTILIGGYETENNLRGFYKVAKSLPSKTDIKVQVIGSLTHQEIASDVYIDEWGPEVLKGCGFNL